MRVELNICQPRDRWFCDFLDRIAPPKVTESAFYQTEISCMKSVKYFENIDNILIDVSGAFPLL